MGKKKRRLALGQPLVGCGNDRFEFMVFAGRWLGSSADDVSDCVVITQEQYRGGIGGGRVFRMAIEPEAVETIRDGLGRWMIADEMGRLAELFEGIASKDEQGM